jgi:hypothetical protein
MTLFSIIMVVLTLGDAQAYNGRLSSRRLTLTKSGLFGIESGFGPSKI